MKLQVRKAKTASLLELEVTYRQCIKHEKFGPVVVAALTLDIALDSGPSLIDLDAQSHLIAIIVPPAIRADIEHVKRVDHSKSSGARRTLADLGAVARDLLFGALGVATDAVVGRVVDLGSKYFLGDSAPVAGVYRLPEANIYLVSPEWEPAEFGQRRRCKVDVDLYVSDSVGYRLASRFRSVPWTIRVVRLNGSWYEPELMMFTAPCARSPDVVAAPPVSGFGSWRLWEATTFRVWEAMQTQEIVATVFVDDRSGAHLSDRQSIARVDGELFALATRSHSIGLGEHFLAAARGVLVTAQAQSPGPELLLNMVCALQAQRLGRLFESLFHQYRARALMRQMGSAVLPPTFLMDLQAAKAKSWLQAGQPDRAIVLAKQGISTVGALSEQDVGVRQLPLEMRVLLAWLAHLMTAGSDELAAKLDQFERGVQATLELQDRDYSHFLGNVYYASALYQLRLVHRSNNGPPSSMLEDARRALKESMRFYGCSRNPRAWYQCLLLVAVVDHLEQNCDGDAAKAKIDLLRLWMMSEGVSVKYEGFHDALTIARRIASSLVRRMLTPLSRLDPEAVAAERLLPFLFTEALASPQLPTEVDLIELVTSSAGRWL